MAHIQFNIFLKLGLLFYSKVCQSQQIDYWRADLDENKNCEKEDKILRLSRMEPSQCQHVVIENEEEAAFRKCKTELALNLQDKCEIKVLKPGQLLYCKDKRNIKCCYSNETCSVWSNFNPRYEKAKEYLKDKKSVLKRFVKSLGYKTCHHLDSLDAGKCADDCQRMEEEQFAKNCTSGGGLFKCCIQRKKQGCNECKTCCTLPMCTYTPGGKGDTYFDGMKKLKLRDQKNKIKANEIFFSDTMYCLKPDSHEDPQKWQIYEMDSYRQAFDLKTLKNVRTFKYDKYTSFLDPKVFKFFTKTEKNGKRIMEKSYGHHYTKSIPGYHGGNYSLNVTACIKKCIQMEKSSFARRCSRNGGYFKCCVTWWTWDNYETTRNNLIRDGLINDTQEHVCNRKSVKNPCLYCSVSGVCTTSNPFTGKTSQLFYPNKKQPSKSRLDGAISKLRFKWCMILDLCKYHSDDWDKGNNYYANKAYLEAVSREEVCAAAIVPDEKKCSRMLTENIIHCSKEDEKVIDSKILLENRMIIQTIETTKKKRRQKGSKNTKEKKEERNEEESKIKEAEKVKEKKEDQENKEDKEKNKYEENIKEKNKYEENIKEKNQEKFKE